MHTARRYICMQQKCGRLVRRPESWGETILPSFLDVLQQILSTHLPISRRYHFRLDCFFLQATYSLPPDFTSCYIHSMRLINTSTLKLHEFYGTKIPRYAILSHRWETEEVTFQDFQSGKGPSMAGWTKIVGCCSQALRDTWEYAWVDSCCIDKTSSAELSEAINSMFRWYQDAEVCYVYLSDVCRTGNSEEVLTSQFKQSKWFTRGWTLQELLAPDLMYFFDINWQQLGTKKGLSQTLTKITGIDHDQLLRFDPNATSIAQKMSWASQRQTTRIEDQAYCLMGIFDIFMPPLYGEGTHAFMRLQFELIKQSDDDSIFAWGIVSFDSAPNILADSPQDFYDCGTIVQRPAYQPGHSSFTMTNKGVMMEALIVTEAKLPYKFILLECRYVSLEAGVSRVLVPLFRPASTDHIDLNYYSRGFKALKLAKARSDIDGEKAVIYCAQSSYKEKRELPIKWIYTISVSPPRSIIHQDGKTFWARDSPGTWKFATTAGTRTGAKFEVANHPTFIIILSQYENEPRLSCFLSAEYQSVDEAIDSVLNFGMGEIFLHGDGALQLPNGIEVRMTHKRAVIEGEYIWTVKIDIAEGGSRSAFAIQ